MTRSQISEIEKVLDIKLNDEYANTMINYPFHDKKMNSKIQKYLIDDYKYLIEFNSKLREKGITEKKKWLANLFVIGMIDEKNLYFINCENTICEVYSLDIDSKFSLNNLKKLRISANLKLFIVFCKSYL